MIYTHIAQNKRKTIWFLFLFTLILGLIGYAVGEFSGVGWGAVPVAVAIAILTSIFSYYNSDKIVLAISGAKEAEYSKYPHLVNSVEGLAIAAGLPMPRLYIIYDTAPNAFATGRDPQHAVICVTTGLLQKLDRYELEGVIGHEMAHIGNRDILLMTIVSVMAGTIVLLGDFLRRWMWWGGGRGSRRSSRDNNPIGGILLVVGLILAILSPIIAAAMQAAISRRREFLADASGALLTRNPDALADALEKLEADQEPLEAANKATAHLYIVNPIKHLGLSALFQTHPPIEERVRRLRAMSHGPLSWAE
jgi:heat shock protein HtpX